MHNLTIKIWMKILVLLKLKHCSILPNLNPQEIVGDLEILPKWLHFYLIYKKSLKIMKMIWKSIVRSWENQPALSSQVNLQNQKKNSIMVWKNIFLFFKGHLISKWFFEVFDFLQKTNENKSHSSKVEFIRSFFGRNRWPPQKNFKLTDL